MVLGIAIWAWFIGLGVTAGGDIPLWDPQIGLVRRTNSSVCIKNNVRTGNFPSLFNLSRITSTLTRSVYIVITYLGDWMINLAFFLETQPCRVNSRRDLHGFTYIV